MYAVPASQTVVAEGFHSPNPSSPHRIITLVLVHQRGKAPEAAAREGTRAIQNRTIPRSALAAAVVCAALALIASAVILSASASDAPSRQPEHALAIPAPNPSLLEILQSAQALTMRASSRRISRRCSRSFSRRRCCAMQTCCRCRTHPSSRSSNRRNRWGSQLPGHPSLLEVLTSVNLLAEAAAPPAQQVRAQPPQAAVEPPPAPVAPARSAWYDAAYSARVLSLVNAQRANFGLRPVGGDPRLTNAAAAYARVLADNHWFSHTSPDGSTFVQRIVAAGVPLRCHSARSSPGARNRGRRSPSCRPG